MQIKVNPKIMKTQVCANCKKQFKTTEKNKVTKKQKWVCSRKCFFEYYNL